MSGRRYVGTSCMLCNVLSIVTPLYMLDKVVGQTGDLKSKLHYSASERGGPPRVSTGHRDFHQIHSRKQGNPSVSWPSLIDNELPGVVL